MVREGDLGFPAGDLDFSPNGRHVAISGGPGALQVLDATTGQFARSAASAVPRPNWLTYSADGSRVLTSGGDALGALWDGDIGELLAHVATPERFTVASFGQDTAVVLIVGEFGGPILRWNTVPEHAAEFACRVAGRDITEAEWTDQFSDRPYQHICRQQSL